MLPTRFPEEPIYLASSGRKYLKHWVENRDGKLFKKKKLSDVWTDITQLGTAIQKEKIGYPTQKPEALLERIIKGSSKEGDVIADFFMGGGTTGAVALKSNRRFIGCDISRVAVSVSANRLINIGEELSGVTVREKDQKSMDLKTQEVADIHVNYVGSYPVERFAGMPQQEFSDFVLKLYEASPFTGKAQYIHGLANGKLVLSVGPSNPKELVSVEYVRDTLEEVLRQYASQLAAGEERILQVIGWGFHPSAMIWKGQAVTALNKKGLKVQIDLISLSSETFRQKIFRHIGESNIDLKFNRLNKLLSFSASPYAGNIGVAKQEGLTVTFTLEGAKAVGTGRLINSQWDFNYRGGRFGDRGYALNRDKKGEGDFEAVLTVEYTFPASGTYTIAAKVQDNLDGEEQAVAKLILDKNSHSITPFPQ